MSSRPYDFFHQSLISQYRDLIHEAIVECEIDHKSHLNKELLNNMLLNISHAALIDGLSEAEVQELIIEAARFELRELLAV